MTQNGSETITPHPNAEIEIGNTLYRLSEETQKHIEFQFTTTYEKEKSVLVIQEPHDSLEGQFNLFRGLESLFRDNPQLIERTIFLAEGNEANTPISVQSLIQEEPNPSDDLIRQVLGSFLITGYMAYEWKYQHGIPIIGTENKSLYARSREYYLQSFGENNKELFYEGPLSDTSNMKIRIPYEIAWRYTAVARNLSMARTVIKKAEEYDNPILFVGGLHLGPQQKDEFLLCRLMALRGPVGPFWFNGVFSFFDLLEVKNFGIYHYLAATKIGFTVLDPVGIYDNNHDDPTYMQLFRSQRGKLFEKYLKKGIDYEEYLEWFLQQKDFRKHEENKNKRKP